MDPARTQTRKYVLPRTVTKWNFQGETGKNVDHGGQGKRLLTSPRNMAVTHTR